MALFDIFTGDPAKQAAEQQRAYYQQLLGQIGQQYGAAQQGGLAALQSGQAGALGAIGPAVTQGRADVTGMLDPAVQALISGRDIGAGALAGGQAGGLAALSSGVGAATGAFDPLAAAASGYSRYY